MLSLLLSLVLLVGAIHKYIVYPLLISPLACIPNAHFLSPLTSFWIEWNRYKGHEIQAVYEAVQKKGAIVRLGPNEISINSVEDTRIVHRGKFDKTNWYDFFMNHGVRNAFSTYGRDEHALHRRRFASVYTKSYIQTSSHFQEILSTLLVRRYIPVIVDFLERGSAVNILDLNLSYGLDLITSFIFGLSRGTNFIQDVAAREKWFSIYLKSHPLDYMYWLLEWPNVTTWLRRLGIHVVPKWYMDAQEDLNQWALQLVDATEVTISQQSTTKMQIGDLPIMYAYLRNSVTQERAAAGQASSRQTQRLELASECLDHIHATRDTFGITATYMLYQISLHPKIQTELRQELLSISDPLSSQSSSVPLPKDLEGLPLLDAVIKESVRLRNTVPTSNPRWTPANQTTKLGPYDNIPSGVRVDSFAYCMHHNETIYKDSHTWKPERWFHGSKSLEEMEKWFCGFGIGRTICVGQNLAMEMLRYLVAAIYTNFTTSVVNDEGFQHNGEFVTGGPENSLYLKFANVEA